MVVPEWSPEHVVSPGLAAEVIAAQFPELAGQEVRAFDAGWDNVVLAVGHEWLFRFVHRTVALEGAVRERAVLLALADRLPLAVPHPRFLGTPTPEVPWPFWGARRIPGRELAVAQVPDDEREPGARALGSFLAALHAPALATRVVDDVAEQGVVLPVDPMGRANPPHTAGRARERLEALVADFVWQPDPLVMELLDAAAAAAAPTGPPVLVHGDLHVRHVLVPEPRHVLVPEPPDPPEPPTPGVTGVIDWGDVALGDPAIDLSIGFAAYTGPARAAFLEAYGDVDPARELAARILAVRIAATLAQYAAAERMAPLLAESLACLHRAAR